MSRVDELIAATKLSELVNKKEEDKQCKNVIMGTGNRWCSGSSSRNRLCSILLLYAGLSGRL